MLTLWDLLDPILSRLAPPPSAKPKARVILPKQRVQVMVAPAPPVRRAPPPSPPPRAEVPARRRNAPSKPVESTDSSMQAKYDAVVRQLLDEHGIRVRKWRKSMSGIAWYVLYRDGTRVNLIEATRPRGPMSAAIFLHEIGHHAIGFNVYKPRCLEEYHAWRWSLEAMERHGLNITDAVRLRMHRSLWYAVSKAQRRGIKRIPVELEPFIEKPSFARRRVARA